MSAEKIVEYFDANKDGVYGWIGKENMALTESVYFESSSHKKSMSRCALVAQQKTKVETKNDWLAIYRF